MVSALACTGTMLLVGLTVCLWARARFGDWSAGPALLGGVPILVAPRQADLGAVPAKSESDVVIRVSNLTGRSLVIHGLSATCGPDGCIAPLQEMPVSIAPYSKGELHVGVKAPSEPGRPFRLETAFLAGHGPERLEFRGVTSASMSPAGGGARP
jgi:hypothetical protein